MEDMSTVLKLFDHCSVNNRDEVGILNQALE